MINRWAKFGWFHGTSTIVGYLMPNLFLYILTVLVQPIQFEISTQFKYQNSSFLSNSAKFNSILPIDMTLSDTTTSGQCEPGSDGNERVSRLPQSSSINRASPSDFLVSLPGHSLGESYPSAEMKSVYSTALADWTTLKRTVGIVVVVREVSWKKQ